MVSAGIWTRRLWTTAGLGLILVARPLTAQAPAQTPEQANKTSIIRTESSLVLVDAVVTDEHNHRILNLSSRDFTVYEDNVPQTLESCRIVSQGSSTPASGSGTTAATGGESSPLHGATGLGEILPHQQYMVLLLDYATTELENQVFVRAAAQRYFLAHARPGLQVAVVRVGLGIKLLQDFTYQPEKIVRALEHQDASGSNYAGDRAVLRGNIEGAQNDENSLQQYLSSLANGPNTADSRAGQRASYITALLSQAVRQEKRAFAYQSFANQQQSRPILEAIRAIANSVAELPGRKSLVLISRGFSIPEPLEGLLYRTTEAANRAHIAIYSMDSGGLHNKPVTLEGELHRDIGALMIGSRIGDEFGESMFDRARQVGSDQQDGTLRYLSAATGGLFIHNTNDFELALGRIEQDSNSYYVLAYRPHNLTLDGKFRHIRVAVAQRNLEVRSRTGYFAMPQGAAALSPLEYQQVFEAPSDPPRNDFPIYVEPVRFLQRDGSYLVELPIEVPLSAFGFPAKPEVMGVVRDSGGSVVSSFRSPEVHPAARGSLSFTEHLHLGSGTYLVELVAWNPESDRRSYHEASLRLEPARNALTLSNLVLSQHVEPASSGEETPWTAGNVHIFPCPDPRFHNRQDLIFYFNVYHPELRPETGRPEVVITLALEQNGHAINIGLPTIKLSEIEDIPVRHVQVARYLKLDGLPPGPYFLRAKVEDLVAGITASTQAAFELEP